MCSNLFVYVCVCASGRRSGWQVSACRVCVHCLTCSVYSCHVTVCTRLVCVRVVCERGWKKQSERNVGDVFPPFCNPLSLLVTHTGLWTVRKASVGLDLGQGLGGSLNTHIPHPTGLNTSLPCTIKGRVFSARRTHIGCKYLFFILHNNHTHKKVICCSKNESTFALISNRTVFLKSNKRDTKIQVFWIHLHSNSS